MCSVCCQTDDNFNLAVLASVSAAASAIAVIFSAFIAYKSMKISKNASFNTLFAQLMDNHISIFSKETLKVTSEDKKLVSVFTDFFDHCKKRIHSSDEEVSKHVQDIYNDFLNTLVDSSDFSRCFKFVYHEIKTVQNTFTEGEKDERKHYIGIIQASMNYDELFAYFINLLQHFANMIVDNGNNEISELITVENTISGLLNKKEKTISELLKEKDKTISELLKKGENKILELLKEEDSKFLKLLKEDEFFKNLTEGHSTKYQKIIEDICNINKPLIKVLAGLMIKEE